MVTAHSSFLERYEAGSTAAMSLTPTLVAILTVAIALLWWWRKAGEVGLPPGPRGLPLLGSLPFLRPDLHRYLAELARTYGPVMRLRLGARLCVVLSSPEAVKEAMKDDDTYFRDHDVPAVAHEAYGGKSMLWVPYGPHWRMIRKLSVRELLSPATLEGLYSRRRREVLRMVEEVRGKAGVPVDVRELLFATMLNVITGMLWGGTAARDGEGKVATVREFQQAVDAIGGLQGLPNVSDFFPALAWLDLQGLARRMRRDVACADRILNSIVEQRLRTAEASGEGEGEAASNSKDFLQVMLEHHRNGNPQAPFTIEHVKALLLDMVAAATETTSSTVEWAMAELLSNPEKMIKAKEEIEIVVGKDSTVEESHLPRLHYLDAILKEVLRLHPAGPLLVPHRPNGSSIIAGHKIPKGCKVVINVWAMHRDPLFWEKASKFEPERFLSASDKLEYNGNNFFYLPFGVGRRICAGISMAERMVKFLLASLLYSANWTLPDGMQLDLVEKFGLVMKKEQALVAVPTLP